VKRLLPLIGVSFLAYYGFSSVEPILARQHGLAAWSKAAVVTAVFLCLAVIMLLPQSRWERLRDSVLDVVFAPLNRLLDRWDERERQKPENVEFERRQGQLEWELENQINPLPLEEAIQRAEALLSDPAKFECINSPPSPREREKLAPLAPHLQSFFETHALVLHREGSFELDREVGPSMVGRGLIVIGRTGLENEELSVLPGQEAVREVMLDVPEEDEEGVPGSDSFTSVYHCIICLDREHTLLFSE
jgi:hypothetical protein